MRTCVASVPGHPLRRGRLHASTTSPSPPVARHSESRRESSPMPRCHARCTHSPSTRRRPDRRRLHRSRLRRPRPPWQHRRTAPARVTVRRRACPARLRPHPDRNRRGRLRRFARGPRRTRGRAHARGASERETARDRRAPPLQRAGHTHRAARAHAPGPPPHSRGSDAERRAERAPGRRRGRTGDPRRPLKLGVAAAYELSRHRSPARPDRQRAQGSPCAGGADRGGLGPRSDRARDRCRRRGRGDRA